MTEIVRKYKEVINLINNLYFVEKLLFDSGRYYKGFLNNDGLPNGPGVLYFNNGFTREGETDHNGMYHGKLIYIDLDKIKYMHVFANGKFRDGFELSEPSPRADSEASPRAEPKPTDCCCSI